MNRRIRPHLLLALALVLAAASAAPAGADPASAADAANAPPPSTTVTKKRFFVHTNVGVNVYTYLDSTASGPSMNMSPADRVITLQQVGVGYRVIPQLRVQLTLQFAETLTGLPSTSSSFTTFAVIPWMAYTHGGFYTGAGPLLAPRASGKNQFDLGLFTSVGYTFNLRRGFALGVGMQLPMMFLRRFSFAISPAAVAAYRF